MPSKQFELDEQTTITVYKRASSRSIRLSVTAHGAIRVSMPTWLPYRAGVQFAKSRQAWIDKQRPAPLVLKHGQPVGKAHHLKLVPSASAKRISSRVVQPDIIIKYPEQLSQDDPTVQAVAHAASIRALRSQAEKLLPQRLASLAAEHNFRYRSVTIKQMTSRWGSCDQHQAIVLNLYLMQLPWECIDYVLLHELTHTEVMHHDKDFWNRLGLAIPHLKAVRAQMRSFQPVLHSADAQIMQ